MSVDLWRKKTVTTSTWESCLKFLCSGNCMTSHGKNSYASAEKMQRSLLQ
uniref:Uncharacterized protein n=1 Tax=Brassica oleracea var. oleracea TaxID=109376 RepID=A0A0D3DP88_BRAOL